MPANVYTSLGNTTVYTDKLQISTAANAVTYQVFATALGTASAAGNIYSSPISIPANTIFEVYSGAGNRVTITGTPFTALELGTASSAQSSVISSGS
jgi:serine protease inhibitor